jgi:hypothetical protein
MKVIAELQEEKTAQEKSLMDIFFRYYRYVLGAKKS